MRPKLQDVSMLVKTRTIYAVQSAACSTTRLRLQVTLLFETGFIRLQSNHLLPKRRLRRAGVLKLRFCRPEGRIRPRSSCLSGAQFWAVFTVVTKICDDLAFDILLHPSDCQLPHPFSNLFITWRYFRVQPTDTPMAGSQYSIERPHHFVSKRTAKYCREALTIQTNKIDKIHGRSEDNSWTHLSNLVTINSNGDKMTQIRITWQVGKFSVTLTFNNRRIRVRTNVPKPQLWRTTMRSILFKVSHTLDWSDRSIPGSQTGAIQNRFGRYRTIRVQAEKSYKDTNGEVRYGHTPNKPSTTRVVKDVMRTVGQNRRGLQKRKKMNLKGPPPREHHNVMPRTGRAKIGEDFHVMPSHNQGTLIWIQVTFKGPYLRQVIKTVYDVEQVNRTVKQDEEGIVSKGHWYGTFDSYFKGYAHTQRPCSNEPTAHWTQCSHPMTTRDKYTPNM